MDISDNQTKNLKSFSRKKFFKDYVAALQVERANATFTANKHKDMAQTQNDTKVATSFNFKPLIVGQSYSIREIQAASNTIYLLTRHNDHLDHAKSHLRVTFEPKHTDKIISHLSKEYDILWKDLRILANQNELSDQKAHDDITITVFIFHGPFYVSISSLSDYIAAVDDHGNVRLDPCEKKQSEMFAQANQTDHLLSSSSKNLGTNPTLPYIVVQHQYLDMIVPEDNSAANGGCQDAHPKQVKLPIFNVKPTDYALQFTDFYGYRSAGLAEFSQTRAQTGMDAQYLKLANEFSDIKQGADKRAELLKLTLDCIIHNQQNEAILQLRSKYNSQPKCKFKNYLEQKMDTNMDTQFQKKNQHQDLAEMENRANPSQGLKNYSDYNN